MRLEEEVVSMIPPCRSLSLVERRASVDDVDMTAEVLEVSVGVDV